MTVNDIKIVKTTAPKAKPADESKLGFGRVFSDHMFMMDYTKGKGWHDPQIVPFGPIEILPTAAVFHYGQETFEGLKAYRCEGDEIRLFRPDENFKRLNLSNERLCIPTLDVDFCVAALNKLVDIDRDWVPRAAGASLYIRPFCIAVDPVLKVHESDTYKFFIVLAPSGAYYATGLAPVKIYVEDEYVRAVRGGLGEAKTGGNYAASLKAGHVAEEQGYAQVLWLDGVERKYIEEVGAMNIFFVIDGEVVTPELQGSILSGITRKSSIEVLRQKGYKVTERRIAIAEIAKAYDEGKLQECFGTGTAAVISPVGQLKWGDKIMTLGDGKTTGKISMELYDTMTGIQYGKQEGPAGWSVVVK